MFETIINWLEDQAQRFTEITRTQEPAFGAVIYTDLLFGVGDHSGIYVGNHEVVSLRGDGRIRKDSLRTFTGNLTTINTHIYMPCDTSGYPVGSYSAGSKAIDMIGESRSYHLLVDNCHQFCAGCLHGNFENSSNFLWMLKDEFEHSQHDQITWKKWRWNS
ncbi:MAG TPA: lecithin retinol acyltransferase family protein [Candidatus Paenibacillus intestinavium]|nr:lecithin retinol acyltransferase family protein [Candidatus Paenibacillus intestinavium]